MMLTVAILAGGLATRLRPLTEQIPKALLEIDGKPFIRHQLELLKRNGVSRVVLCVGHLGEQIREAVGTGGTLGMEIAYAFDGSTPRGTGGALIHALPLLGERFLVLHGDAYLECDYPAIQSAFLASGKLGLMTVFRNNGQWDRSNVLYGDGRILRYDKAQPTADMAYIDYGLGALRAAALSAYPADVAVDLAVIYQDLVGRDQLAGYEVERRFYEIGSPAGLAETRRYLSARF